MSPRCQWLVLCEHVLCDEISGQVSLINCLEELRADSFPCQLPRFGISARYDWVDDTPAHAVRIAYRLVRWSDSAPEPVVRAELNGEWKPNTCRARVAVNFHALHVETPERLYFRIDHQIDDGPWVEGCSTFLDVSAAT